MYVCDIGLQYMRILYIHSHEEEQQQKQKQQHRKREIELICWFDLAAKKRKMYVWFYGKIYILFCFDFFLSVYSFLKMEEIACMRKV